ncbi:MAG TPA: hypothetical protein VFZ59_06455 [Verrucomicrobiae bacterium]|nr:hypothetical protein [Verrucomicrobiae bacterium]
MRKEKMNNDLITPASRKGLRKLLPWLTLTVLMAAGLVALRLQSLAQTQSAVTPTKPADLTNQIAALQAELNILKGKATDQSHVMADVGYHFANLWFAGDKENWPLAKFYFDETRSHLRWAVRVIPMRKDLAGENVDLKAILDAVDSGILSQVQKTIEARDHDKFVTAYKQTLEACYACHKASSKPYLRPQIPQSPPQPIINFDPNAKWPE